MKLLVIAGSWPQAKRYAEANKLAPDTWVFVRKPDEVVAGEYVLVGTYQHNPQWPKIEQQLKVLGCTENPAPGSPVKN